MSTSTAPPSAWLSCFGIESAIYFCTVGLAFVHPIATLAAHRAIALQYCFAQLGEWDGHESLRYEPESGGYATGPVSARSVFAW